MKKPAVILTMALMGIALASCNKKQPGTTGSNGMSAAEKEAKLRAAYGFAAQIPSDTEGYFSLYRVGAFVQDFKQSKTWAAIRSNPLFSGSLDKVREGMAGNPEAVKWRALLGDALGNEAFVAFGPGSGAKIHDWLLLNDRMRMLNLQNSGPGANKENIFAGLLPYLKMAEVPPVVLGFKVTMQKAAISAELDKAEKMLPPGFEVSTFDLAPNQPFKSIVVAVGKGLPANLLEELKKAAEISSPDPATAEATYQALLSRRVEIAYGYIGDYLLISVGTDHSHLKLAQNFAGSILERPEVTVAANYADKKPLSFSWSDVAFLNGCQQPIELTTYYLGLKKQLAGTMSAEEQQKLEADLKRIDQEGTPIFTRQFTPMVGIIYRENGLHGEVFGGLKTTGAQGGKFAGVPTESTFLWIDAMSDPVYANAVRVWFEDLAATSYDLFQRFGVKSLNDKQQEQFEVFQTMGLPKITELYRITRDQFSKSLGQESALALDLTGKMPAFPMVIPQPISESGKMVRLAYLSDVKDRALLGQSWDSYFKLANDMAKNLPQTATLPGGLPLPTQETTDGVTIFFYPLPTPLTEFLPNVAVTNTTFVVGTSKDYSIEISKAALKSTPGEHPLSFDFRMNFKPALDFTDTWLTLASKYPSFFYGKGEEQKGAELQNDLPAVKSLLDAMRVFRGFYIQTYEENGVRRSSSQLLWKE